jgi:hypothetical protein
MHAHEKYTYMRRTPKVHTYEMHAFEIHAHEKHS